jgi:outer membrane murein-binding lipoprotein Lpp
MKPTKWIAAILTSSLLTGCMTTGLSPREQGVNSFANMVYSLCAQQETTPQAAEKIALPIRLGVAQIGESAPAPTLLAELRKHPGTITEVIEIPLAGDASNPYTYRREDPAVRKEAIQQKADTLRKIGAQVGADYVLLIGGNIDSHITAHPIQILDMAILPGLLIPSQTLHMDARAAGALINTRTGMVRTLVSTTTTAKKSFPTLYEEQTRTELAIAQRDQLSQQLVEQLIQKLHLQTR